MVEGVPAEQRKPLEDKITKQWDDLKKDGKSLDDVRQLWPCSARPSRSARRHVWNWPIV